MKIIKNINNNFAVAVDDAGNQLVVSGKGIGFGNVPREVKDMKIIDRSYYDVEESYVSMINEIPQEIISVSEKIIDMARLKIDSPINSNIIFTLADHIKFSIDRYQKKMNIKLPIVYEIQHLFEKEMKIGDYGLDLIRKQLKIGLPKEEAVYIALHIINAEEQDKDKSFNKNDEVIDKITQIIEKEYSFKIDRDDFNYSRFVSHMHYLLKRGNTKTLISTDNNTIYEQVKEEYHRTYQCVLKVSEYLSGMLKIELSDEEKLYLMLHINRLCTREDCNQ